MVLEESTKRLLIIFGALILVYVGIQGYRMMSRKSQENKYHAMMEKVYEENPGLKEEMKEREEMLRLYGPRALAPGFKAELTDDRVNDMRATTKLEDGREKITIAFSDGQPKEEYFMKDGYLVGSYKRWGRNGELLEESIYENNQYNGPHKTYYVDGTLKTETLYVNGVKQGASKNWLRNGKLSNEIEYLDDKVIRSISYYPDNSVRMTETLDKSTGVLKTEAWYTNGELSHQFFSKSGKREGLLIKNTPAGLTVTEAEFKDGKNHGRCRGWDEKGELITELFYQEGFIDKSQSKIGDSCNVDIWRFGFR